MKAIIWLMISCILVIVLSKDILNIVIISDQSDENYIDIHRSYLGSYNDVIIKVYNETLCDNKRRLDFCKKQRTMLILEDLLHKPTLSDFTLIIEKSTFVHIKNLMSYVHPLNCDKAIYIGSEFVVDSDNKYISSYGGILLSRGLVTKLKKSISVCILKSQDGIWVGYHSDWVLAKCINDSSSTTTPTISSRFTNGILTPKECKGEFITCSGYKSAFELGQTYIKFEKDFVVEEQAIVSDAVKSRLGLLQSCHFYVPLDYNRWPRNSFFYHKFNKSSVLLSHPDYHRDMTSIFDEFKQRYPDTKLTNVRVLYGDVNHCSKCFPVITKSRPVDCGLNILSWIHYHRHFQVLNDNGVNLLKKYDIPYSMKRDVAVWRGTTTGLWTKNISLDDVRLHQVPDGSSKPSHAREIFVIKYYNSTSGLVDIGLSKCGAQTASRCDFLSHLIKDDKSIQKLLEYKFLVSLQGNDVATGLKWMLASNSVVFMPESTMESWILESQLKQWVHYVPIKFDGSDLLEKIEHAIQNPHQMMSIVSNAKQYMSKFLNFYEQVNEASEILKYYIEHVHFLPEKSKYMVKCSISQNSSWLYNQLKGCNLTF